MKKKSRRLRTAAGALGAAIALSSVPAVPAAQVITAQAAPMESYFLRGDVADNDGITARDALMIQMHEGKAITLEGDQFLAADANNDGEVGIADAVSVLMWIVKNESESYTGEYCLYDTNSAYRYTPDTNGNVVSFRHDVDSEGKYKLRIKYSANADTTLQVVANNGNTYTPVELRAGENEAVVIIDTIPAADTLFELYNTVGTAMPSIEYIDICRTVTRPDKSFERTPVVTETSAVSTETETTTVTQTTTASATETTMTTTTTTTAPVAVKYYAVDAEIYDGWEENTNAGFEGKAYVNYNNAIGSYVEWTIEVPEDGNYAVTFRYANGTTTNRPTKLIVNGEHQECVYLDFNGTGAWTTWADNTVVLELKAGTNTIKARATTTGGGPNVDYIEVEKTSDSAVQLVAATDGKRVENLNRGVSSAHAKNGNLVSWRHLATDNENTTFNLWRITENDERTMIGTFTMDDASNYFDSEGTATDVYTIDTYVNGECTEFAQFSINLTNTNSGQSGAYFDIPTQTPPEMTMPDGTTCTYTENDCSVGDVDGDGQYEIFVKWDPSNSQDNSKDGYTGDVFIDCYKLDGTLLWRVDLGKNIRAGAHYTQFMVYDFDGDGKAEMICKTSDGTKDGQGNVVGDASKDYRSAAGRILTGNEYLTLFDGQTGKALDTVNYKPGRGTVSDWGDSYGNRVDRFVACVAYLDGENPSAVFGRGYYTRVAHTAYNVVNKKLVEVWAFDTGNNSSVAGYGDGNHHSLGADVDGDGKDEVVYGSGIIDDNGKLLYTTGLAHGDAIHIGDFVPSNPGLEIFQCLEDASHPNGTAVNYGTILRAAGTGKVLFRETAGGDTGRCIADNLIAGNDGAEMAGSHNAILYDCTTGQQMVDADGNGMTFASITKWGQNSVVYWTDVLERAVLDRTMADQYGKGRVFTGDGVTYNNASKSNACITCDLFGDWREEMIFRKSDGGLRVFSTTYTTEYGIYSLMQNPQYRVQVAAQNNGYNQPPHTDYFLGTGFALPVAPEVHN